MYTMASGKPPLSPDVYDRAINWRRFFMTLGSETPQDIAEQNNGKSRIVGAKFLLVDNRDVSTHRNKKLVDDLDPGGAAVIFARTE